MLKREREEKIRKKIDDGEETSLGPLENGVSGQGKMRIGIQSGRMPLVRIRHFGQVYPCWLWRRYEAYYQRDLAWKISSHTDIHSFRPDIPLGPTSTPTPTPTSKTFLNPFNVSVAILRMRSLHLGTYFSKLICFNPVDAECEAHDRISVSRVYPFC